MRKKAISSLILVFLFLFSSVAGAAIPNNTVIIGESAYSTDYLMNSANLPAIQTAIDANGDNPIYYQLDGQADNWTDIMSSQPATIAQIAAFPVVTYYAGDGATTQYAAGNGNEIPKTVAISAITATNTLGQFKFDTDTVKVEADFAGKVTVGGAAATVTARTGDGAVEGKSWKATFEGAKYNTEYTAAFATPLTIGTGEVATFTFAKAAAAAPDVTNDDVANTITGADATMEYSVDNGTTWTDAAPADLTGDLTVLVRVKANAENGELASEAATLTFTVNDTTAPAIATAGNVVTNYQTLTVAFTEKVTGTPTVTVNGTAVDAATLTLATDGMSLAIAKTAGYAAGSYTVVVNGLSDVAGNAMTANAQVIIAKAASYVADFTFTTNSLDATAGNHKVYFTAIDQYTQNVTASLAGTLDDSIVATGTMGEFPLAITYAPAAANNGENWFTITDNLIAAKTVTVTLTNTVSGTTYTKSQSYTVAAAAAAVPTSISAITHAVGNNITVDDDNQVVTITVLDQYGNPVAAADADGVRWVTSNKAVVAFNADNTANFMTTNDTLTFNVDAIAPGTATITVFLAGSTTANATLNLTVAQSSLTTLTWGAWDQTFNQEVSTATLTPNAGAVITAAELHYVVDTVPAGATVSDISITFEDGTAANLGKVLVKATTAQAGTYTFRVFKGASITAAGAVVTATKTLTTIINPAVASITIADATANELTAGVEVKKAITFKNAHNETVSVNAESITAASTSNMAVAAYATNDAALTLGVGGSATPVAKLGFTGTAAGTDTVTIVTGAVSKSITLTTVASATLTSFALSTSNATVIIGDTYDVGDATATDNVMIDDGGKTVVLIPITFSDQYGNAMNVNANAFDMAVTGAADATRPQFNLYGDKADGTAALADGAATAVKYVGLYAEAGDTTQSVTLQMRDEADTTNIGTSKTVTVTVNAARALASISVAPTSGNSVVNISVTFTLSGVDQYGVAVNLADANTQLQTLTNVAIGNKAVNATDGNKSDFTLTASAAGSYTATIFYSADGTLDAGEKSTTVALTTGTLASTVDHIVIQPTVTVASSAAGANGTYNASNAKVALDGADADQTITFTIKAYDAINNEVAISQTADVVYTVLTNSITSAPTITFAANTATVNMTVKAFDADDSITIQATSLNGKTATLVVNVADIDDAAAVNGRYYLANANTGTTTLTTLTVAAGAAATTIHVVGIDQFGKPVAVAENDAPVLAVASDDATKATAVAAAGGVSVTGVAAGATTVRVIMADGSQLTIPVTVNPAP